MLEHVHDDLEERGYDVHQAACCAAEAGERKLTEDVFDSRVLETDLDAQKV